MTPFFPRALLGSAGLLLLIVGAAVLINPVVFAAANGVDLPDVPSVLSEYRAPGGMLFASAVFILIAAVRSQFIRAALMLSALVYCSYGVSRLIGIVVDGIPSAALMQAMVIELLIGSLCLMVLLRLRRKDAESGSANAMPFLFEEGLR